MELNLGGKNALVTGASRGIGRTIADVLASEGCNLWLVARSETDLLAVRREIADAHDVEVTAVPMDLSQSEITQSLSRDVPDIDVLVNNAGAIPGGTVEEVDETRWRAAWDLKVFAYINLSRDYYSLMKARGRGVIINIIGAAGERPTAGYIAGSTGNAALMAFTQALGGASPADGIRVVGVNPGPVATDRMVNLYRGSAKARLGGEERWKELVKPLAFGRMAKPEEIAKIVAVLASDVSAYISGTIVTIDGGQTYRGDLI